MKTSHLLWFFLALLTALRLRVASQIGMTVDEAHYVLYGRLLDWSYFDHPPLVGWVHAFFQILPIDHLIKARLPALLISVWTSRLIFNYLVDKNVSQKNSLYSVVALNLTPIFNTMSMVLLPDSLLMPLTLFIIQLTETILTKSTLKNWLRLGVYLGLAGLAKYTSILFVVGLVLIFIAKNKYRELLKYEFWLGVLVAAILVSPVLYWNIQNDFISFKYQIHHVSSLDSSIYTNITSSFAIQFISWGLGPFLVALATHALLIKHLKSLQTLMVIFIFISVFILFFIYVSISEVLLPHWMLIYFILMIPLAYSHLLERIQSRALLYTLHTSVFLSALLSSLLMLEVGFRIFPSPATAALYEGVTGWPEVIAEANSKLEIIPNPQKGLAVMNWTLGSRAMYYNTTQNLVFVLDSRFDQFDLWNPRSPAGYDFIVIIEAEKKEEHLAHLNCAQLTAVGEKLTTIKNVQVNHFLYYHCSNFLEYK